MRPSPHPDTSSVAKLLNNFISGSTRGHMCSLSAHVLLIALKRSRTTQAKIDDRISALSFQRSFIFIFVFRVTSHETGNKAGVRGGW